jgi:hypothetical protein
MRTALYRHYDDHGTLLYVGISLCAIGRLAQHKQGARWFEFIAKIEVEWFDTREEAEAAERLAIQTLGPVFNNLHRNHEAQARTIGSINEHAARLEAESAAIKADLERSKASGEIGEDGFACPEYLIRNVWAEALRPALCDRDGQRILC